MQRFGINVKAVAVIGIGLAVLMSVLLTGLFTTRASHATTVEVWKDPSCGCCNEWIKHMQNHGFVIKAHNTGNQKKQQEQGIAPHHRSCHTALVDGYAIEGHVPAEDINRLLDIKADAVGLSVPGMVVGSPGMDGAAYRGVKHPYDVLLLGRDGSHSVFSSH
ncbi:DUF411 domain-containing protein [Moraxella ovis]|uniref:DUF411 domain-containing protein n=1 Tax=Moraxella ovis TaxID=29433 RepID=UPI000D9F7345|nr:DUF411 domain-containing protein [Moraxella ovis]SPX81991.1 Protein of uncharacterised function, DUF [Moraxella ovis]STZ05750.1 Protein of uncharacterised function, DUF [Moraxella ovis]